MPKPSLPVPKARLSPAIADHAGIDQAWDQGNQEWWDWYVTLAENAPAPSGPAPELPPLPKTQPLELADLAAELAAPYPLTETQRTFFRRNGYIKLKNVVSADALLQLRRELRRLLSDQAGYELDGGARDRFLSLDMVWLENDLVREFVLSARIGRLAAELLGVRGVRLYHDNVMSKEPGCGRTPWHYDDHHFPIASNDVVSVWIPVQPIPRSMGPLAFASPKEAYRLVESVPFSKFDTSYDRRVDEVFQAAGVEVDDGPFDLGEVSFHHNLSFHTAAANLSDRSRIVLSNTYFADGARLVDEPTMVSGDWQKFAPGVRPGELLRSAVNPICWSAETVAA